ncbi:MAG: hypothetical protein JWM95_317 [Gemmatimonadetes bacterium]|nr:hypothetical protein [Gemmatimonadota bacterium]
MNCREFRRKHDAYIDDTLSGVDLDGMANHRRLCDACSQLDTRVRRALLLARNMPTIQPSSDFAGRLQARLTEERASLQLAKQLHSVEDGLRARPLSVSTYAIIAAGVLAAAGLAGAATRIRAHDNVILLTPVIASMPEPERAGLTVPTLVAAMPAGMPIWPAVFVAQQAPWHFASDTTGP